MADKQWQEGEAQEGNLLDLLVMFYVHRKLFIATVLIITIIGSGFAWFGKSTKQYIFRQPLQIASYYLNGQQYTLQGSKQIISVVTNLYVPTFVEQYRTQHPNFNEAQFIANFKVTGIFTKTQEQEQEQEIPLDNKIYFEFKGSKNDLALFQQASSVLLQEIHLQEQPLINSLTQASKSNLQLLQTQLPKLEKLGELLESNSVTDQGTAHQKLPMSVSARETYLALLSQSQTVQNVIQFKQTINDLSQKVNSLMPTVALPMVIMTAQSTFSFTIMTLLSFFLGLLIAAFLVFAKGMSRRVKEQLKIMETTRKTK